MYLIFPAGMTEFIDSRGVKHFPDSSGQVDAPASELVAFFSAGFVSPAVVEYAPDLAALHTPFLVAASQTAITIKEGTHVKIINGSRQTMLRWDADTTIVVADYLDAGAIEAGKDYYVYACEDGSVVVSLNSTFPAGYSADNSRKIGGFHTLCCAVGVIVDHPLSGFATGAILPLSVWCLNWRSRGQQEGHRYDEAAKIWKGIYGQSGTGATTGSVYGATITDTRSWLDCVDDLGAVGDRLLDDVEFQLAAEGSNQKTNIYGSVDPGTWGKCACYLSKTGTWAAGVPASAWIDRAAYVPPAGAATEAQVYEITISTGHPGDPNYFTYKQGNPGGALGAASAPIEITGAAQALADGLLITFPAAVGWVTGETATFVVMNGLMDTAGRRMISHGGSEAMCGVMWQWLRDQSYRFDRGAVAYVAAAQTTTITHAAAPGGNPIYVKFGVDGTPYLCSNLATVAADVVLTFGTNYKVVVKHDPDAATGGLPLYFDYDATLPYRFLINNTLHGKDAWALSNDPNYLLPLKHDAAAAVNGVAVNYDDGADSRLEYIGPTAANATMGLAMTHTEPAWGYTDPGGNKGQVYKQGSYGDVKLLAGGDWAAGSSCGSRCRGANNYRWNAYATFGARGCAEPR